jgi:hypothetical protein
MDRRAIVLVGSLVLALAAYATWWFALAASLRDGLRAWIEARRAEGWTVAHGDIETSGFPFRLILSLPEPSIAAPGWSWSGPVLKGVVKPWGPDHVIAAVEGRQVGRLGHGEAALDFALSMERAVASFRIAKGRASRVDLEIVVPVLDATPPGGRFAAQRVEVHYRANEGQVPDRPAGSADIALSAEGLRLPEGLGGPLGADVASAAIRARIKGDFGLEREALARWRDDGGTIEIEGATLAWGPLDARLDATLALDKAWRPIGAGTLRARGYDKTIDAVEAARLLRPVEAQLLRLALATRAKRDGDPRAFVDLPATAQDGRLFVGPVPVLRLQPLF